MASRRPAIHGYDHVPGGPDPIPTSLLPFANVSYIIANRVNGTAFIATTSVQENVVFDQWTVGGQSPTSVFSNTTSTFSSAATGHIIYLNAVGLYGVFTAVQWEGGNLNVRQVVSDTSAGMPTLSHDIRGIISDQFWGQYAANDPGDPTGTAALNLRDFRAVYADIGNAYQAVMTINSGSTATQHYRAPQLGVFYIGVPPA